MDVEALDRILTLLKKHQAFRFKCIDFEVELHGARSASESLATRDHSIDAPVDEQAMPIDLRAENINNFDHILNWSGTPEPENIYSEGEVVSATGDVPLT